MNVQVADGAITFRRHIAVPAAGAIPEGPDADPGVAMAAVISDAGIRPGYVSLKSQNMRVAAVDFTITDLGRIWKIGWVNVIRESARRYHYEDGMSVTETLDSLPTWDGGADDARPFYFGNWFSTHEEDEDDCVETIQVDSPMDIIFNDSPCMPPSYDQYNANGTPLGKFNISPPGYQPTYMTRIDGYDRYLACLVVVDESNVHKVAWSVPWDVTYRAVVSRLASGLPSVVVGGDARTRVNFGEGQQADSLVQQVMVKPAGETLKRYRASQPVRHVRTIGPLRRTMSTGDLKNRPF